MNEDESGSRMCYPSYVLHCDAEVVGAVGGCPGSEVQQVDLFGASAGLVVTDVVCYSVGIDQFNWLSLLEKKKKKVKNR